MQKIKKMVCLYKRTLFVILIGILLSLFVLYTPAPKAKDAEGQFSAYRAQEHIEKISREPHSYYDREAHEVVRQYLVDTLTHMLGASNVLEMNYTNAELRAYAVSDEDITDDTIYDIENVLGVIPGENEDGILLVAHYDSRGHVGRSGEQGRSYGAMDDGYGVSSMLELAYVLKDINPKNSIYFLFTDAEEVGLFGAKMAAQDATLMDHVKFVMNLESRGRYGATYMFETSKNNAKIMDLYRHANYPVTYSIATAVYSIMPNFTDFTPFIEQDVPGFNFATLAGLDNYHSPLDRYENINLASIQHMGDQVEPLVREFASDAKYIEADYFKATSDHVFFLLFTNVFIQYSEVFAIILAIVLIIAMVVYTVVQVKKQNFDAKHVKKSALKMGLYIGIFTIAGLLFGMLVAFLGQTPFKITYVRVSGVNSYSLMLVLILVAFVIRLVHRNGHKGFLYSAVTLNLVLMLMTVFALPGASFMFMIPSLTGLIVLAMDFVKNRHVVYWVNALMLVVNILITVPLLYSLYMALTVGGMVAVTLLLSFSIFVIIAIFLQLLGYDKNKIELTA